MPTMFVLLACLASLVSSHLAAGEATVPATAAVVPLSPTDIRPLVVGSAIPVCASLRLPDGTTTGLAAVLQGRPTVLVFYRGDWCPFCTRHLASLAGIRPDLTAAGWKIVAVAPDQPSVLATAIATGDDGVPRLSDASGELMRAFGIAYRVDDATDAQLKGHKIDLAAAAGNDHRWLPVPSVFLIAADGTVRFVHADPDYKVRLDPKVLLAAAKAARQ